MKRVTLGTLLLLFFGGFVNADNWPQWRGPKLDSRSSEKNLPDSFDEENQLWEVAMPGPGGSSPIVWEDKLFVASVDGNDLVLMCFSVADGKENWRQEIGKNRKLKMDRGNAASCSPVTDGKFVWSIMADGVLHCFDMDGQLQWKKEMQKEYGKFMYQFGMTSTPLLDNGRLYLQFIDGDMRTDSPSRGKLIALEAKTGKEIWVHERNSRATHENKHSYTSPVIYRRGDKEILIAHGADCATGHRLENGEEIWRVGGFNPTASYNNYLRFVSSPVCNESMIVLPSAKNGPVIAVKPDAKGQVGNRSETIKWRMSKGTPDVATPVITNGRVFLARENGVVICLDADTGEKYYEERLLRDKHRSTPVVADGKIYLVGRDGAAIVLEDSSELKVKATRKLGHDTTASPAISNGKIFIRTSRSLFAFGKNGER